MDTTIQNGVVTDAMIVSVTTAGKVSGSAITSGTIAGTTAWSTSGAITATGVTTLQNNATILGSTSGSTALTDTTNKINRLVVKQYTNANTDWVGVGFVSTSSYNAVEIGGGTSAYNCATQIDFITAANQTTVTGTNRGGISSTGAWTIGPSAAGPTITATIRGSANNGQLLQLTTPSGHTSGGSGLGVLDINTATITSNTSASFALRIQTQAGQCFSVNNAGATTIGVRNTSSYPGQAIAGCTDASNATAGDVGEYIEATSPSVVSLPGTDTYTDIGGSGTGITLTAGDWDITLLAYFNLNGATCTSVQAGIGTGSGTSNTGLTSGTTLVGATPPTATAPTGITIANYRVTISSTTTYYGKVLATYSAGTPQYRGRISARRVR